MLCSFTPTSSAADIDTALPAEQVAGLDHDSTRIVSDSHGEQRVLRSVSSRTQTGRIVDLKPGERLRLSDGHRKAELIDASGDVLLVFDQPTYEDNDGTTREAYFKVNGNELIYTLGTKFRRDACGRATAGKWTMRVGAAFVCGAFGAATSGVGGGACGLAYSGLEDHIDFDRVCH